MRIKQWLSVRGRKVETRQIDGGGKEIFIIRFNIF